jgi:NADH-quinone oxidoreductase subunit N
MALFMFSLTGIPPTSGFVGKYYLIWASVEADLIWLAAIAVVASLVSAAFYLRVVVTMYFQESAAGAPCTLFRSLGVALVVAAVATLVLGLWPGPALDLARESVWSVLK